MLSFQSRRRVTLAPRRSFPQPQNCHATSWAERNADLVLDDEGEETLGQQAVNAAIHWPRPITEYDCYGRRMSWRARFAIVVARMRAGEWADEFWIRVVAPAALGFQISVLSSAGEAHDRLSDPLPEWVPNHDLRQQRHLTLCHLVVNGDGYHYLAARVPAGDRTCGRTAELFAAVADVLRKRCLPATTAASPADATVSSATTIASPATASPAIATGDPAVFAKFFSAAVTSDISPPTFLAHVRCLCRRSPSELRSAPLCRRSPSELRSASSKHT